MKLAVKLTVTLMSVIIIVVSIQAVRSIHRVSTLHLEETRDEMQVLASTLGSAVDAIWNHAGPERARDHVARANAQRPGVTIRLLDGPPARATRSWAEVAALPAGQRADLVERTGDALVARVALGRAGATGVLELERSLAPHQLYVEDTIWRQATFTAALLGVCSAALLGLGFWFIGRPVKRLVEHARAVAAGDFAARARVAQRDEIGALADEMNHMSEELEQAWNQLREERRARTSALEQLRHSDRLSTVGKLASGIAHELGTPLNVISGRAMMLASAENCPAEVALDAEIIVQQSEHMTRIIAQLLDFSRRRTVAARRIDLRRLVGDAVLLVEPLAEEQRNSIEISGPGQLDAEIDQGKVLQVLTNLMINAIQAMPEGGALRVSVGAVTVDEPPDSHATPGEYARIAIEDHGVGIAADELEHIFEPFFTTKGDEGSGLGLSVSHGIVKEHGGWIAVHSVQGEGSEFSIYLPRVLQERDHATAPGQSS